MGRLHDGLSIFARAFCRVANFECQACQHQEVEETRGRGLRVRDEKPMLALAAGGDAVLVHGHEAGAGECTGGKLAAAFASCMK